LSRAGKKGQHQEKAAGTRDIGGNNVRVWATREENTEKKLFGKRPGPQGRYLQRKSNKTPPNNVMRRKKPHPTRGKMRRASKTHGIVIPKPGNSYYQNRGVATFMGHRMRGPSKSGQKKSKGEGLGGNYSMALKNTCPGAFRKKIPEVHTRALGRKKKKNNKTGGQRDGNSKEIVGHDAVPIGKGTS